MDWLNRHVYSSETGSDPASVRRLIESLRPAIATAAQGIYDQWVQDADGIDTEFGGGGICDAVNREIQDILAGYGFDTVDGGQDGDDHAYSFAIMGDSAFEVDIPPYVYETGGGMSWRKKQDVVILPKDVMITPVAPEDVRNLIEDNDW